MTILINLMYPCWLKVCLMWVYLIRMLNVLKMHQYIIMTPYVLMKQTCWPVCTLHNSNNEVIPPGCLGGWQWSSRGRWWAHGAAPPSYAESCTTAENSQCVWRPETDLPLLKHTGHNRHLHHNLISGRVSEVSVHWKYKTLGKSYAIILLND